MILNKVLSLNSTIAEGSFEFLSLMKRQMVSLVFPIIRYLILLPSLCPVLVPWKYLKLRVTSPLLIILANRSGIHWILTTLFFFIRGLWPRLIQWLREKIRGHLQVTWNLGYSHSSLPTGTRLISVPPPL